MGTTAPVTTANTNVLGTGGAVVRKSDGTVYVVLEDSTDGGIEVWKGTLGTGFQTEWQTTGTNESITLPLYNSGTFNCVVTWGDGSAPSTITAYNDADRVHTYASAGTYTVEIFGECPAWSFQSDATSVTKIKRILHWGTSAAFGGFSYLQGAFDGCTNLTSMPVSGGMLAKGTGASNMQFLFDGCTSLTNISNELFAQHTSVTAGANFQGFHAAFQDCSALTSIPANLFNYNTGTLGGYAYQYCFYGCTNLTSIPADLFKSNTTVGTYGFLYTFGGCTSITSIPADLFKTQFTSTNTTYAFNYTFNGCTSLTSIPTDLFRYCTKVTTSSFLYTFENCTSLSTVPTDTFRYNTLANGSSFSNTFKGCTSLATVPEQLFAYNTSVTGWQQCFYGCTKLQLNQFIFYADGDQGTRFNNQSPNFSNCFDRTSFTGDQGVAPDLWNCDYGSGTPTTSKCYGGAGNSETSLSNYNDIPAGYL